MEAGRGDYVMMEPRDEVIGLIMKGKRTKRQRLQDSLPFSIFPSQSEEGFLEHHNNGGSTVFSSSFSLDQVQTSADEDEEQDMAHCLILLAQGVRSRENTAPATSPVSFRAKGKLGRSCDYECKTCGRTFHSFQALGGHRASHKKPKAVSAIEDAKKEPRLSFQGGGEEEEEEEHEGDTKNRFSHPLSLSLNPRTQSGNTKSNKTHECSICGAEFSSGQALGGHMRRHRAPLMAASPSSLCSTPPGEKHHDKRKRRGISLDLDLNLPAEAEDDKDGRESRLMSFISSKHHVFSSPALVDCHY